MSGRNQLKNFKPKMKRRKLKSVIWYGVGRVAQSV